MTEANQCFVAQCERGALASVTRDDLPGSLRLCATHTEQFRQSSEGWAIAWAPGDPEPSSVTAPSSDNLWAYRPSPEVQAQQAGSTVEPGRRGLPGLPGRAADWLDARRAGRRNPPK